MLDQNLSDLMQKIEHTVRDISQSQSVTQLRQSIDSTVKDVKDVVRTSANAFSQSTNARYNQTSDNSHTARSYQPASYTPSARQPNGSVNPYSSTASSRPQPTKPTVAPLQTVPDTLAIPVSQVPGRVSGILMVIGGISGMILSATVGLFAAISMILASGSAATAIASLVCFGGFTGLAAGGFRVTGRVNRYRRYRRELGGVTFSAIAALADAVHRDADYVAKDLQKMIDRRFFPEGHLDAEKKTFILDNATYQQYRQLTQRVEAEKAQAEANPELTALIREGDETIRRIREANDAIPGIVISQKLDRLQAVVTRIYAFVEKHPERIRDIRRFTSYYLPTTLKLVTAYREFDAQEIQGETVRASKEQIEETLDLINQAFETMLDELYEPDARDLSADISVLQTMLKQEGLTDSDFSDSSEPK